MSSILFDLKLSENNKRKLVEIIFGSSDTVEFEIKSAILANKIFKYLKRNIRISKVSEIIWVTIKDYFIGLQGKNPDGVSYATVADLAGNFFDSDIDKDF